MLSGAWLLWYTQAKEEFKNCTPAPAQDEIAQLQVLWSNLSVQIEELNKPEPRGEERKTGKVRGQPGSSISLCAGRETASAVGGRHNQTETQIENRQGQEDTETGEWVHWLLLLCNAVAASHHCRLQRSQCAEPHLATIAGTNDLVLLPSTGNYGDAAHHEVPAAVVLCAVTPQDMALYLTP